MAGKIKKSLAVTAGMTINHAPEAIWPLLCPVREYDWMEPWKCEVVHTVSGVNELGCVFRTEFLTEGDKETWVTSRFEPNVRLEFVRTNSRRAIRFVIKLEPIEKGTRMSWTQHVTPLNEEGETYLLTKPEAFAQQMRVLETMLNHYLDKGTMMSISGSHLLLNED